MSAHPDLQALARGLRESPTARAQLDRDLRRLDRSRRTRRAGMATGGVMAAAAVALLLVRPAVGPKPAGETLRTPIGGLHEARLADGSQVTLNTDTRLLASVAGPERRVRLETGEALFDVVHDGRPFVVSTPDARIRVVGTAFTVRAEPGRTVVSVLRGRVAVAPATGGRGETALTPGMRLDTAQPRVAAPGVAALEPDWRAGRIAFTDARLADVLAEANRYYPEPLVLGDAKLGDLRLTGSFPTHDSAALRLTLERVFGLKSWDHGQYVKLESGEG